MAAGYELNTRSTSASQTGAAGSGTSGAWNINFGSGSLSATAMPSVPGWVWIAAAVVGAIYVLKRAKG